MTRPAGGTRARDLNSAAQQAGLSPAAVRYESIGDDVSLAADNRARMIREAQAAGGPIPVNLTPASEAYWNDADMRQFAAKNLALANRERQRYGLPAIPEGGSAPFAPSNIVFGGHIDRNPNEAYGMQDVLAPGAARLAAGYEVPANFANLQARPDQAFGAGTNLRSDGPWQPPAGTWDMQSRFDPSLNLSSTGEAPMAGRPMNVPVAAAYGSGMDLMGGAAPAPRQANGPVAAAYGSGMDLMGGAAPAAQPSRSTFDTSGDAAQGLNARALEEIRRMRRSGIQNPEGVTFNPGAFGGSALF